MHTYELVVNTKDPGVGRQGLVRTERHTPERDGGERTDTVGRGARDAPGTVGRILGGGGRSSRQAGGPTASAVPDALRERMVSMST
ncbi:hypothetical protein QFZ64_006102 [Streptomyces sp. B3I8]|nr:hypothetical protein [Streptomyces sp. B3I8]